MKISGMIAEFNPFHNGHKYILDKMKESSDAVVCIMSGSFVQRGDVGIFDKWVRAEAALLNGADLIIELPVIYSASAAERFAFGAIELLSSLCCIDELWFGSESGNIEELINAGATLNNESKKISEKIKTNLSNGVNYPRAHQAGFSGLISNDLLNKPNNILGLEYIKALIKLNSNIKPVTVQRKGTGYHDFVSVNNYASASALRPKIIFKENYFDFIPKNVFNIYKQADIYSLTNLNTTILYLIRSIKPDDFTNISGVSEGLENRLKDLAKKEFNIDSLINNAATKRYTKARIRRILTSLLLGIDKNIIFKHNEYIRVLGFNDAGRDILKIIKKKAGLPIIIKTADYKEPGVLFEKDILATDIAALSSAIPSKKSGGMDFTTPPIYIKSK